MGFYSPRQELLRCVPQKRSVCESACQSAAPMETSTALKALALSFSLYQGNV